MRRVGVLMAHLESAEFQDYLGAFRDGLQQLGWTEGRNIRIDVRWGALDDAEGRQQSAKELVALQPDLIITAPFDVVGELIALLGGAVVAQMEEHGYL